MKILIADSFAQNGIDALVALGASVEYRPQASAETLAPLMDEVDPDVLVVRSTRVDSAAIAGDRAGARRLKLIVRAGAGYDTIDVACASTEGILVANCPGKNAIAVAELAIALILSCDRRVPEQTASLRAGNWNKKEFSKARGLCGRTLGLVGFGPIAREVAKRASAFGMRVIAWSRSLTDDGAAKLGVERCASLRTLAEHSDVVSVHVAATAETRHLIDAEFIDALKPGAIFVNTARGSVVDEAALIAAIETKHLRAGLDVYEGEPGVAVGPFQNALAASDGVCGTHHVGASTDQAQEAIGDEVVRIVSEFVAFGSAPNCVNRARRSTATCLLTVRHRNRPGVLAKVFDVLSRAGINVEEMENMLYDGKLAACARIQLTAAPGPAELSALRETCSELLSLELSELA